jgi:hypothetical protein
MAIKMFVWTSIQIQLVASWAGGMDGSNEAKGRPVLDKPFCKVNKVWGWGGWDTYVQDMSAECH